MQNILLSFFSVGNLSVCMAIFMKGNHVYYNKIMQLRSQQKALHVRIPFLKIRVLMCAF